MSHIPQSVGSEAAEITRVLVKGMAEWRYDMCEPPRGKDPLNLVDNSFGILHVLQYGVTFDALEQAGRKGKVMGISYDVHPSEREQVHVYIAIRETAGAPYVQIPASQGYIQPFSGIHDE